MCAHSGSVGGSRSASGRLRRRPQRWEGPPVGGGILSRLASPRAESTASAASHGSTSPVPPGVDARAELWAAADRARQANAGQDAVRSVLETQRTLVSRLAAARKVHVAFLKRSMRKRANRLNEQDRIEDAALRNACSATASTPAATPTPKSATKSPPDPAEEHSPSCVVPLRLRLPLDSYLPRRVRGAPTVYDPADIIAVLPPKRHRLGESDPAEDADSEGTEGDAGRDSPSPPNARTNATSVPVSEADEQGCAASGSKHERRGRRDGRSKKRNNERERYAGSKRTKKREREKSDKRERREKKNRRRERERDREQHHDRDARSSEDEVDERPRRQEKLRHRSTKGHREEESARGAKRRFGSLSGSASASDNDLHARARNRSCSPSPTRSTRHEQPLKRSRRDRDERHSDMENSDVAPRHRRTKESAFLKKRRPSTTNAARSRTPSEISVQQPPTVARKEVSNARMQTSSRSPSRSLSPASRSRTVSRTPSRPRTPADDTLASDSQSEEDQVEIEEEEEEDADEEEAEAKGAAVQGEETDEEEFEVEVEEEEEIGIDSGNAANQAGSSSDEYSG